MTHHPKQPLAIVGLSGRFPGAADLDAFWALLAGRGDAIGPVPADRWDASEQLDPEFAIQSVGGFLNDVGDFDATFFGISPREAEAVDPQHRLMLEEAWRALEDAGTPARRLAGTRTGVYVGSSWHDYEIVRKDLGAPPTQHSAFGNAMDMTAARVSYFLKLRGPSLAVETGCSSSLVALHLACQALRAGEIDGALVGGVNLILSPDGSVGLTHFGGLSPTGRCRAFSAAADGFVRGEGVVALYIKTLEQALADGDQVRAVIVATGVNNDGGGESIVTPDPGSQERLLREVYAESGVPIDDLAYLEAHGTGTGRGDPVEAEAIGRALGRTRSPGRPPLAIGSVKTNIGHLEPVAGLAGLVKAVLALEHRIVPPSLHAEELNPAIAFGELNVQVAREPLELPVDEPVYLGVNSFGWGGTNAHVVIAGAPVPAPSAPSSPASSADPEPEPAAGPVLLTASAQRDGLLPRRATDIAQALAAEGAVLSDVAGTLARRRDHFPARLAIVAEDPAEAADQLARYAADPANPEPGVIVGRARTVGRTAFVFPGQGSQWPEMASGLYAADPVFRAAIDRCAQALAPHVEWDPIAIVTGRAGQDWMSNVDVVQPVLWAVSVALAEVWRASGVEPDIVVGHSQGEIGAATVAGILSLEQAALIVARRSQVIRRAAGHGRMLAVDLDVDGAKAALAGFEDSVALAVNNGPRSCVLSGDTESVLALKELLEADGVFCRLVNVDYASHSPQMAELRGDLLAVLAGVTPRAGRVPLMSTVSLAELAGPEMDVDYWVENLCRPVMFADALTRLFDAGVSHVVEISAHPILTPAVQELAALREDAPRALSTLRRDEGSPRDLGLALARAYVAGLEPFGRLSAGGSARVPGYPWERRRYWVEQRRRARGRGDLDVELTPAIGEQDVWEGALELAADSAPWLVDHKVHEAVVVPGAALMALALRTGLARAGTAPRALSDVRFLSDLTLGDQPARLAATWREDITAGGSFRLSSLAEGATEWTTHAEAKVRHDAPGEAEPEVAFPERLLKGAPEPIEDFYAACAARGLNYGPAFQGLTRLFRDGAAALGEIVLPRSCHAGARPETPHPALWDAALQVALLLFGGEEAVVPRSVDRLTVHRAPSEPVLTAWSFAVRRADDRIDYHLFDAERRPWMTIEGLAMHRLPETAAQDSDEQRTYRLEFPEQPVPDTAGAPAGSWCVLGGDDSARELLLGCLGSRGAEIRAAVADDPDHVVFIAPAGDLAAQRRGLLDLTELVRAAVARPAPPRVVIVTAHAQAVTGADVPDPGAALYWGYGRVLRREHPELRSTLIDIDTWTDASAGAGTDPETPSPAEGVVSAVLAGDEEDQLVLRAGRRFAARLVRGVGEPASDRAPWRRPDPAFRLVSDRPGFWDGLAFRALRRRAPGPGEVEVAVTASALNFLDVMKAMGTYPDPRGGELFGTECAGVVTAVGPGVEGLQPGRRVVACAMPALASHLTVRADHVRAIPEHLSDADAAALPMVLATAWYGLVDLARTEPGETILIHSAAGGLGLAAVAVAELLGAQIIATAGTEAKRRHLRELGIRHVFDSRDLRWAEDVRAATGGRGVDVVLNSLTGAAIPLGLDLLADCGRFVEVGKKDVYAGRTISMAAFKKGVSMSSVDIASLMNEHPKRFARLLEDVWSRVADGSLNTLPVTEYPAAQAPEALREMARGAHTGKLVITLDSGAAPPVAPDPLSGGRLRSDGTYLLTGGLGALGLSLARYLADAGAGSLALLGRSAPTPEAEKQIAELREQGVTVRTFAVDVADEGALAAVLAVVRQELPQLRGVVHAAGLLDDATIATLRGDQLERVLAPKVDGARHLDRLTRDDPLDFLVLFSSAAALLGNAGQAAYAAGNAFMDALAERRRRTGLPGLSVQWGPFTGIGLAAADDNRGARLAERGMNGFTAEQAWPALVRYIQADLQTASFLELDLRQWFDSYPDTAALASWSTLRAAAQGDGPGAGAAGEFLTGLHAAAESDRAGLLDAKIREIASRVLRLDPAAIEDDVSFKNLGLDSLMSLEFRNRLESTFALRLSPTLLWTFGTVRALSGALAERIFAAGEEDEGTK